MIVSRFKPSQAKSTTASVLMIVLVGLGITCLIIGTFMSLSSQRSLVSARSLAWNDAMPVAEAGLEEALTQIQYAMPPTNGWTLTNNIYTKTRASPFNDTNVYYVANILNTNPPIITVTGFVHSPLDGGYIYRTIQVNTKQPGRFPYGVLSKGLITLSGSSRLDSFASCDPNYSTNGAYDPAKAHDQIKLASLSSATPAIKVGTGKILGYVDTSAGGTVTYGSSGSVGDAGWVNGGTAGFESGHVSSDMNISISDATTPYTFGTAPLLTNFTYNATNYGVTLTATTNYYNGSFSYISQSTKAMLVTNQASFYVVGSFTISGSGFSYIAPGGTLTLYVGTTNAAGNDSVTISGGGIANGTGNAANFSIICLPSVKTVTYSGSAQFVGTLYAPEANLTMSGSADGVGALVANTVTMSGGMNFHYDECLGSGSGFLKYIVLSWKEL